MVQGYWEKISYKINKYRQVPKENRIIVKDTHEPIISKEQFLNVQNLLLTKRRSEKTTARPHIFSGKLKCADCGLAMYKKSYRKNTYIMFRCKTHTLCKSKCSPHAIPYQKLYDIVFDKIRMYIKEFADFDYINSQVKDNSKLLNKKNRLEKELSQLKKELEKQSIIFKKLYMDKINGIISQEQFIFLTQEIEKDKLKSEQRIASINKELEIFADNETLFRRKNEIIEKYKNITELNYEIISTFIDYIEIGEKDKDTKNQEITIYWLF